MKLPNATIRKILSFIVASALLIYGSIEAGDKEENFLWPQSAQSIGEKRVLMVAVRFPDAQPTKTLGEVKKRVIFAMNNYVKEQSYGLSWIKADFKGWVMLPDSLSRYQVSPYNFKVDRGRVRKLIEDTLTALENEVDFSGTIIC